MERRALCGGVDEDVRVCGRLEGIELLARNVDGLTVHIKAYVLPNERGRDRVGVSRKKNDSAAVGYDSIVDAGGEVRSCRSIRVNDREGNGSLSVGNESVVACARNRCRFHRKRGKYRE